jgi:thioredoxin 2
MRELVYEMQGVATVARVDIEASAEIAESMGVSAAPTVVILVKGQVVAHVVGFQPSSTLKQWVRRVLRSHGAL